MDEQVRAGYLRAAEREPMLAKARAAFLATGWWFGVHRRRLAETEAVVAALAQLLLPPQVVLADNGDFLRLTCDLELVQDVPPD